VRLLFVTADMGSGHHEVTAELMRRCAATGAACSSVDVIADAGAAGARLRATYRLLLRRAPGVYDAAMRAWARWPGLLERFTARNAAPFERLLADAVAAARPDVVVSTYNLASQCLGRLRRRRAVDAPVVTVVPDPGAHPYWISPDVTAHLVPTALTAERFRALGAPGTRVVRPTLRMEFRSPPDRTAARAVLGLPGDRRVVLLTAGSWAVGGLPRTVELVRQLPDTLAVVLCGRDERLRTRLSDVAAVRPVGWTDEVVRYLSAADVVVDNAGGVTCWEALACGARVVAYRPLAGHGRLNVATLAELGWVRWAHDGDGLRHALTTDGERSAPAGLFDAPDAADVVRTLAPRP